MHTKKVTSETSSVDAAGKTQDEADTKESSACSHRVQQEVEYFKVLLKSAARDQSAEESILEEISLLHRSGDVSWNQERRLL